MEHGVGGILSSGPAEVVQRLVFPKEAAGPDHNDLFEAMARVNLAHAVMLHRKALAPPATTKALTGLMLEILEGGRSIVPLTTQGGDLYPQIEAFATTRLGPDVAGFLQLGRSRGDVVPAAMRIKLRTKTLRLLERINELRAATLALSGKHGETLMPAYTHWQHSQVMTLGHFLARFVAWFARDHERLLQCLERHNVSPLGCANGVGTSVKLDRAMTSEYLGHSEPIPLAGDAVYAWDYMIEPVQTAALFCSNAARLMGNFILWHTAEFAMARLSDAFVTTSTYLPQKRNPEPLETVKAFAELVHGDVATIYLMCRNEDFPHSLINHGFPAINRALDLSADAAELSVAILNDISFNEARMRELADQGFVTASEAANTLVMGLGMPFRKAHELVGLAVRVAVENGEKQLTPNRIRDAANTIGHGELKIADQTMLDSIRPDEFIKRMDSPGGINPAELENVLKMESERLERDGKALAAQRDGLESADSKLVRAARSIISK